MDELVEKSKNLMKIQHFHLLQVGVLDFFSSKQFSFEIDSSRQYSGDVIHYFDLASLTKPLTLATALFFNQHLIDETVLSLLNHRAGLPAFGRLSRENWQEQILSYPMKESKTLYSDFSPLRLMLYLQEKSGKSLAELSSPITKKYAFFWKELFTQFPPELFAPTGFRNGEVIRGIPNDDNAYLINDFCSHAGLFSKMDLFLQGILFLWNEGFFSWVDQQLESSSKQERFAMGLDRPYGPGVSLASSKASKRTYGHLGFTGTSFWVDIEKKRAIAIFANATENYSYDRSGLNKIRRELAEFVFSSPIK